MEHTRVFNAGDSFVSDGDMAAAQGQFRPFNVEFTRVAPPGPPPRGGPGDVAVQAFERYKELLQSDPMWEYLETYAYAIGEIDVAKLFLDKPPKFGLDPKTMELMIGLANWNFTSEWNGAFVNISDRLIEEVQLSASDPPRGYRERNALAEWDKMRWRGLKAHVPGSAREAAADLGANRPHLKDRDAEYFVNSAVPEVRQTFARLAACKTKQNNFFRSASPQFDQNLKRLNWQASDLLGNRVFGKHSEGGKYPWGVLPPRTIQLYDVPPAVPPLAFDVGGGGGGGAAFPPPSPYGPPGDGGGGGGP